jgi:D-glycero-beta-D-manno-heptose-7-phosphate kinase
MNMHLPDFSQCHVLVVGDVMLDRYWFGAVNRISPEAPVPVVLVERQEERPGGAANVARNVTALGGRATLLSVVGDDDAGRCLEALMARETVTTSLLRDASISTTVKLRVIGVRQQLLRIDFETLPSHEILANKSEEFNRLLDSVDAVLFSDYGKGGLQHVASMIAAARYAGKPVLVDPKGSDWSRYAGATVITPNRAEFKDVAGRWSSNEELHAKARSTVAQLGLDALIVTRSEEGMSLFTLTGATHEPTRAREVFDVTGAGDTVIATLALMTAAGRPLTDAMRAANAAAGVVVAKLGTATASRTELLQALASES